MILFKIFENNTNLDTIRISSNFFVTIKKKNDEINFHLSNKKFRLVSGVAKIINTEYENNKILRNIKINVESNGVYVSNAWMSVCKTFVGHYECFDPIVYKYLKIIYQNWRIHSKFKTVGNLIDEMKIIKHDMIIDVEANKYNL